MAPPLLLALAPLAWGFPQGHDWSFELVRIAEFVHAVTAGQLPPAWAENLYGGYGSPIFLFYAPSYAALAAAAAGLLGSVPWGAVAALVCFAVLGAFAMWRAALLASGGSHQAARVGAAVYLLHPYLLCDLFLRNANAEYAGLCAAPLALCGVFELRDRPRAGALWLAGGLALTLLAHNLTALSVAAMAAVAGFWLHCAPDQRRHLRWLGIGLALGIGMATFFWLPAVALMDLVRTEDLLTGKFDFHGQFPPFGSLFGYEQFYGGGLLPPVLLIAGVAVAFAGQRHGYPPLARRALRLALVGAALLVLLMLPVSAPVWEHVPLLPFLQFPWRLQGPLALLTALVAALVFARASPRLRPEPRRQLELLVLILAMANAVPHLYDARPLDERVQARLREALSPEALRQGRNAATVRDEYLPRAASKELIHLRRPGPGGLISVDPGVQPEVLEERGSRIRLRVTAPTETRLVFGRWDFPGWGLRVDGAAREIEPDPLGVIGVGLSAGTSEVELRYESPKIRRIGLVISGLAFLGWLGLALSGRRLHVAAALAC